MTKERKNTVGEDPSGCRSLASQAAHGLDDGFAIVDWLEGSDFSAISIPVCLDECVDFYPVGNYHGPDQFLNRYPTISSFRHQEFEVLVAEGEHEFCQRITVTRGRFSNTVSSYKCFWKKVETGPRYVRGKS